MGDTKTCNVCGETKPKSEFSRLRKDKDYRLAYCKACRSKRNRNRYATDPAYRSRVLRAINRWNSANKESVDVRRKNWRSSAGWACRKLGSIRRNARVKGVLVTIAPTDLREALESQGSRCALTGRPLQITPSPENPNALSVDRLNWRKGYVPGNVRLVTWQANSARGRGTDADPNAQDQEVITVLLELKVEVEDQLLADILTQAVESASSYWATFTQVKRATDLAVLSARVTESEAAGKCRIARVVMVEDIGRAMELLSKSRLPRRHLDNALSESGWDDETADVLLQLAVLGEVVYWCGFAKT